jgi:hypothetical protein
MIRGKNRKYFLALSFISKSMYVPFRHSPLQHPQQSLPLHLLIDNKKQIMSLKYKNSSVLLVVLFLSFAKSSAQNYFQVMDSISKMKLDEIRFTFNDTLSEEQRTEILSREEYHNKISSFRNKWYSEHLKAMKEPVVYSDSTNRQIIRFTWLRTFHHPVVVGMVNDGGEVSLYWKTSSGAGGYDPGKLVTDRHKRIDIQQWDKMIQELERISFWRFPTNNPVFGFDGAQWILEVKIDGKYHLIDIWTAGESKIGKFCLNLLSKTGLEIKKNEVY